MFLFNKNQKILHGKINLILGFTAIFFYVLHGLNWIIRGVPSNLLWACNLASFVVGLGIILKKPKINSVGVLILLMGNIFWFLYLLGGGGFEFTSLLTHIGGLLIGLIGVYRMQFSKFSWFRAVFFLAIIQIISRFITPEFENVNLAFRIHEGWEKIFPSYFVYEIYLFAQACVLFFIFEIILRRLKFFNHFAYDSPAK